MALASLSSARPCRNAARRPRATPSAKASSDDDSASTRLFARASRTSRITARRVAIERPRSPCATRPSQTRYCTGSGLSKPYARLVASISAWLDSAGITAAIGSPGARCTIAKTMMLAPSSVGIDALAVEEASEAAPRLEKVPRDVPRVETLVVRGVEARAPAREQRVPLHRLQVDVDADVLEVLLDQLVHGQRQHLARARRRD